MTDSTKVNSVQQKLLEAMNIMSTQSLKEVSFDKTILCTIENNDDKKDGKYKVSDGTTTYTAYSSVTNYNVGTAVYVTIPEGNYNNQKIIIGKKTTSESAPYTVEQPFDAMFDLTGNLYELPKDSSGEYGLTANAPTGSVLIAEIHNLELAGYSKLGLKASFRTYLSEAVKGSYGIQLSVTFKSDNGTSRNESFQLDNSEMFGNSYNFETYYEQQEVVNIENLGMITDIVAYLYQNRDFYDKNTTYINCSTDGYKTDSEKRPIIGEDGYYIPEGELLGNNICVKDFFICAGDDASKFTTDYVELYTKSSKHYSKDDENKEKIINMRWIHVGTDTKTDIVKAAENEAISEKDTYEIRWYRYSIGVAAADEYCGVYWDRIDPKTGDRIYWHEGKKEDEYLKKAAEFDSEKQEKINEIESNSNLSDEEKTSNKKEIETYYKELLAELDKQYEAKNHWYSETAENIDLDLHSFSCKFIPNCLKNNEKIKVIAFYNGVAHRGNAEMLFENDNEVFDASSAIFANALQIVPADNTNGNYLIYGQNAQLQDSEESKKTRTLTAYFDANSDGTAESLIQPDENLTWIFPVESTMIKVLSETDKEYVKASLTVDDWQSGRYYYEEYREVTLTTDDWISGKYYYKEDTEYKLDTSVGMVNERQYYEKEYKLDSSTTFVSRDYYKQIDTGRITDKTINPIYSIDKTYSPSKSNNTIYCEYTLEGTTYTTEKEFTFGPKGTMGTDQTIVIDFVGDDNAIVIGDGQQVYKLQVQLYDETNLLRSDISNITWDWYYRSSEGLTLSDTNSSIVTITKTDELSIDDLFIIKVAVGELETYFPIPLKKLGYSYITGPTQVIYKADGSADYSKEAYSVYETSLDISWRTRFDIQKTENNNVILPANKYYLTTEGTPWKYQDNKWVVDYSVVNKEIKFNDSAVEKQIRYIGNVEKNNDGEYKLNPLAIYVEDSLIYGVQACYEDYVLWTQPILVLQNKWASNVLNHWDGKSLVLDETNSNIIASSIAAGKKNSDNTFSGVMMGDWSNTDSSEEITKQTGVYGFHHGAMSYAFKEDGTAFLGKDGAGRINFNGNKATIESATFTLDDNGQSTGNPRDIGSMQIDLNEPSILMKYGENQILFNASKKGGITSANSLSAPFKIGTQFAVDWDGTLYANNGHFQGQITGDYGQIGNWTIETTDEDNAQTWQETSSSAKITLAGALHSGGTNPHIILNPNSSGSIIIGSSQYNRIVIDATGSGTIKMGSGSVLTGGTIKAGTLASNNVSDRITLNGYLAVGSGAEPNGLLGEFDSNIGGETQATEGLGLQYKNKNITTQIKATGSNVGINYQNSSTSVNNYISIIDDSIHLGLVNRGDIVLSRGAATVNNYTNTNSAGHIYFTVPAANQHGIYARFA